MRVNMRVWKYMYEDGVSATQATCSLCTPFLLCLAAASHSAPSVHPSRAGDDAWKLGDEHSPPPAYTQWDECMSTWVCTYEYVHMGIWTHEYMHMAVWA